LSAFRPVSRAGLTAELADRIAGLAGTVRVAVDGPPCAAPQELADTLVAPLRERGRPVARVRAREFWHDASLRLEHGREDALAYLSWLDAAALRREVLDPVVRQGRYLPSLRDPVTNRATRALPVAAVAGTVLIVSGALLLGLGLPFELTVHLAMSPAARARRTPPAEQWTLAAFAEYDRLASPADTADVVVRADDPRHPAVRLAK
jgi:hypothetical protein